MNNPKKKIKFLIVNFEKRKRKTKKRMQNAFDIMLARAREYLNFNVKK